MVEQVTMKQVTMKQVTMKQVIVKRVEIAAPVERVWRAVTDAGEFGEWFRVTVESGMDPSGAFVVGKEIRGKVLHPGYEHLVWRAVVREMREPELFVFTWHPFAVDPKVDYSVEEPTRVEFRLEKVGEKKTLLTVTESGFEKIPAHRRAEAFLRNGQGWAIQVENVRVYVEARV